MKKNIVIFGSGVHSKVIFSEIIKIKKYNFLGFVDDSSKKGQKIITYKKKSFFNLGKIKDVIKNDGGRHKLYGIIGAGFNYIRKKIVNEVFKLDKTFKWETIISKDCVLNGNIIIGKGSLIMSGVIINTQTTIGNHCIINNGVKIGKNTVIGGNSFVNKKCLDNYLYFGVPIKQIRKRKIDENYL